jgi:hypothetical protein
MRVDKVIMSCDDNGTYLKLWSYVARICREILKVTPVLFHITNESSDFFDDGNGIVKKIKKLSHVKTSIQAQFYRIYGTSFFPNDFCLTSDIDMLIPNKEYFLKTVENIDNDSFVVYCSDVYNPELPDVTGMFFKNRMPLCYYIGKGSDYVKIFEIETSFSNFMYKVLSYDFGYDVPYGDRDEIYCGYKLVENRENNKVVFLKRGVKNVWEVPGRIEKNFFYDLTPEKIQINNYKDFHIPNSFIERKIEFEEIYNQIYEYYSCK